MLPATITKDWTRYDRSISSEWLRNAPHIDQMQKLISLIQLRHSHHAAS